MDQARRAEGLHVKGRNLRVLVGAGALAVLLTGCIGFTVTKEVEGDAPDDATFIVEVECDNTIEGSDDLVFEGEETQFTEFTSVSPGTVTCTVTETEDEGASEVSIECVEPTTTTTTSLPSPTVTCVEDDDELTVTITITDPLDEVDVAVTVTNEFDPPDTTTTSTTTSTTLAPQTAPLAVEVSPTFTG